MDTGLLLLRLVVGLTLAAHGSQKLFGWFGGYGLAGTGGFLESLGFRPGKLQAAIAGVSELGGGLLLALGLLTPAGALLIFAVMTVAALSGAHTKTFFLATNGIEFNLVLVAAATALAFTGPGAYSIDALAGLDLAGSQWGALAVLGGILGSTGALMARSHAKVEVTNEA